MSDFRREVLKIADQLGLRVVEQGSSFRHEWIKLANANGAVIRRTLSRAGRCSARDVANTKGELRRFARGQTHGLIVEKESER